MFELKRLHASAVPAAIEKAMRYRLLNEPIQAESICRDVLLADPENQKALVTLVLALTDQFPTGLPGAVEDAWTCVARLKDPYERAYYSGIVCERRANTWYEGKKAGWGPAAYSWLTKAMEWYEKAESLAHDQSTDDPILRWNTCARLIERERQIAPLDDAPVHPIESE